MRRLKTLLLFLFVYSIFLSILAPIYSPKVLIAVFAPFLTIIYAKSTYAKALWISFIVGLYFDLLASKLPLGFYSLSYCLTTTIVYRYRIFFSIEKWWIFPLYSAIFSFCSSLIQMVLLTIFQANVPISILMIFSDLILLPLIDGLFALCFFNIPIALFIYLTNPSQIIYFKNTIARIKARYLEWRLKKRHSTNSL